MESVNFGRECGRVMTEGGNALMNKLDSLVPIVVEFGVEVFPGDAGKEGR